MNRQKALTLMGLGPSAHQGDLKKAYRRLASKCHPDLNPHMPQAKEKFQLLGDAYTLLKGLLPEAPKVVKPEPVRTATQPATPKAAPKAAPVVTTACTQTATVIDLGRSAATGYTNRVHAAYNWANRSDKGQLVDVRC